LRQAHRRWPLPRRLAAVLCLAIAAIAAGCIYSASPPERAEFAEVTTLEAVTGRYRNRGAGGPGAPRVFLSALIWPNQTGLDHDAIDIVEVVADGASALVVRAHGPQGAVVKESRFIAGEDFRLERGRIQIRREAAAMSQAVDDPLVGPRVETTELGIDIGGHGRYRRSFRGAGLVYLMVPVVVSNTEEVRFERVEE
jgi:hypothetical protein